MNKIIFVFILFIVNVPNLFADTPPSDFMKLEACSEVSDGFCTLEELIKINFEGAKTKWSKDGKSWILHVERKDPMSEKNIKMSFRFDRSKGTYHSEIAKVTEVVSQEKDISGQEHTIKGSVLDYWRDMASTVVAKTGKKDPVQLQSAEKEKVKFDTATSNVREKLYKELAGDYVQEDGSKKSTLKIEVIGNERIKIKLNCRRNHFGKLSDAFYDKELKLKYIVDDSSKSDQDGYYMAKLTHNDCSAELVFGKSLYSPEKNGVQLQSDNFCCNTEAFVQTKK